MKMKTFDVTWIINDQTSLELAQSYHQQDHVEYIEIQQKDKGYAIKANINILGEITTCLIDLDENFDIVLYKCDCIWCTSYSPCGHIGAVLFKLNDLTIDHFPYYYKNEKHLRYQYAKEQRELQKRRQHLIQKTEFSRRMIQINKENYSKNILSFLQKEKYEIEPTLIIEKDNISISYKIGNERKYIIKNIDEFITRIEDQENYSYGKYLQFVHTLDAFDDFALSQIAFIKQSKIELKEYLQSRYYSYRDFQLNKEMNIFSRNLDIFFETYQNYEFDNATLKDIDDKVSVSIDQDEDIYTLSLNLDDDMICGNKHLYIMNIKKNHLYLKRMKLDDEGKTMELIQLFEENNHISILQSEFSEFYKYILLPIIDYLDMTNLPEIKENNYELIRIYGDVDDESQIFFKIYYIDENNNRTIGFNKEVMTSYNQDLVENYIRQYAIEVDEDKHVAYLDMNSEKTYEFINEGVGFLKDYAEIYVSDSLKKLGKTASYHISIGVKLEHDLLSLDIESLEIPKKEIAKVLEQYKRKKKFYRLKSGELLYLDSPQLDELEQFMNDYHIDLKDIVNGHMELNKNRMFLLEDDALSFEYIELDRKASFTKTLEKYYDTSKKHYSIPYQYENILRDYQKEGFIWLRTLRDYGFNGILADDMGLGKTLQVIVLIESLHLKRPSLVVCPSSLIYNWEEEVHKFSQSLQVKCIVGNWQTRQQIIQDAKNYQILVTSYDYMRRDYEFYEDIEFDYVILDEAQYIKNPKTKNAIAVKKINTHHKLALTGTPIENTLAELWSIFDFLMPQYLYNYHYFKRQFENDIVKNFNKEKTKKLRSMVSPFILRRNKKDVLKELPDKIEKNLIIPFSEEESKLYYATLAQANQKLQKIFEVEKVDGVEIMALFTKLRQTCCEPRILYENIEDTSSKMKACMDLITSFKVNHQKVLLFSSFTSVLDLIEKELITQHISYLKLTGDNSKKERRENVEQFQNGDIDVFLISLKAGGTGLNLTSAQVVIHYDPWWNISAQNQATDRAHRIGQKNNVFVYKLVMKNSIEEKILELQAKKKELADVFVENSHGSIASMSKEEIFDLFS